MLVAIGLIPGFPKIQIFGLALAVGAVGYSLYARTKRRKAQEEAFSKSIGGAMVKRTLEAASGTAKRDKEADDRVKRALDRDFGAPPQQKTADGKKNVP